MKKSLKMFFFNYKIIIRSILKMLTVKEITIMEIKQMKYEEQASKEEFIKGNVTLLKAIKGY